MDKCSGVHLDSLYLYVGCCEDAFIPGSAIWEFKARLFYMGFRFRVYRV